MRLLLALVLALGPAQDGRAPLPDPAAQKQTEKLLRDIYKDDYARKDVPSRRAFSLKLLDQAEKSKDDPASRYVILSEARDIAGDAGDVKTALLASELLSGSFSIDAAAVRRAALEKLRKTVGVEDSALLADAFLKLADEAAASENFDAAIAATRDAEQAAQKAKNLAVLTRARARGQELTALRAESLRMSGMRKKLEAQPDDPESNFAMGRYLGLVRGDWERALPHLVKGSNAVWNDLASRELKAPEDTAAQTALGDGWWEQAAKEEASGKAALSAHAAAWYQRAIPNLSGLTRAKVERRLEEAQKAGVALGATDAVTAGLIAWWKLDEGSGTSVSDSSGKGNTGTFANSPAWKPGRIGGALSFNGTNDYVKFDQAPVAKISNTFTMAFWAWPEKTRRPTSEGVSGNSGPEQRFAIYPMHQSKYFGAGHTGAGVSVGTNGIGVYEHTDNYLPSVLVHDAPITEWTHVSLVYEEHQPKLYLNGKFVKAGLKGPHTVHPSLALGETGYVYGYYAGLLDDVRIYDRALSDPEIQKLARVK